MQTLRELGYELDGVIADVERGGTGFDAVCLATIKRVRAALAVDLVAGDGKWIEAPAGLRDAAADLLAAIGGQTDALGPVIADSRKAFLDRSIARLRAALVAQPAPKPAAQSAPQAEPALAEFILRMLVAAGHVPQAKVDEAYAIAAKMPRERYQP